MNNRFVEFRNKEFLRGAGSKMQNCYSKLKILKYPNPILKKRCEEIKDITFEIKELALDMTKTMTDSQGIGLAASQIGELKRIIVVRVENQPRVLINPEIIKKSEEKEVGEEGCLSFPGLFLKIKRAKAVEIETLNLRGEKMKIKAEGFLARVFQHEIDHLDGILFIDRVGAGQRIWELLKFYIKRKNN